MCKKMCYLGVITRNKADQIHVITIRYLHFAPFSDMSLGHKISLQGLILSLWQLLKVKVFFRIAVLSFLIHQDPTADSSLETFSLPFPDNLLH